MTHNDPNSKPQSSSAYTSDIDTDVAIVGAGLIGGTLACALARHGVRTTVVDRLKLSDTVASTFDGRASAIALSSQRLLGAIGIWEHLATKTAPIREIRVSEGRSLLFLHFDHAEVGDKPLGFMAENRHIRMAIEKQMHATGKNLSVVAPASVIAAESTPTHGVLSLDDGRRIRAQLVVSAEGRGSKLREWTGIKTTGWTYPQVGIVATIAHERPHKNIAHEHFLPAGPFAILPLPDDHGVHRSSLVWTERSDAASAYLALSDDAFLMEVSERVGGFLGSLGLVGPRFCHPLGLQFAENYAAGRILLAGDAAHAIHPIAGQGLNLGFRDVAALTEIIVDAKRLGLDMAHPEGITKYERWRRSDNLLMATVTDALNRLFSNDIAPIRMSRDVGLAMVNRVPPLKRLFMRQAMGVTGQLPRLMRGQPLT